MKYILPALISLNAAPALAEESRQLDAHVHGVGELNIAMDGNVVAMELHAPGADIVGFEYEATSAADRAAIDAAVATLARPLDLFVIPAAAECSVTQASAALEGEDEHDKAESEAHDDHDHEESEPSHTEFHAEYTLTCGNSDALTGITFAYFSTFKNALELDVQIITSTGAQAFEVVRNQPTLDLRGMF